MWLEVIAAKNSDLIGTFYYSMLETNLTTPSMHYYERIMYQAQRSNLARTIQ